MKKNYIMMMGLCLATVAQAQDSEVVNAYFTTEEMPDMMIFMPGPPDSTSVAFANDVSRYFWGKEMRKDPERAEQAKRDAVYGLATILEEFEEAFGMKVTKEETPEIYKVLLEGTSTCDSICTLPKKKYMRRRPFMRFNEQTLTPDDEEDLRTNGSYPSGHTLLGWSSALLMMEINPDRANEILKRGYRYGENRLVVGAHWQSDTDAARLAASVAYAQLHTSERFLEQMQKARKEFKSKSEPVAVRSATTVQRSSAPARIYTLSGAPATDTTKGILVSNDGKKKVR
ncbi:MAG: phosphatase PAP2 family protein [Prevotella sp.]|nr:phosphatase PAP2 family protein [Prevotella sp.]